MLPSISEGYNTPLHLHFFSFPLSVDSALQVPLLIYYLYQSRRARFTGTYPLFWSTEKKIAEEKTWLHRRQSALTTTNSSENPPPLPIGKASYMCKNKEEFSFWQFKASANNIRGLFLLTHTGCVIYLTCQLNTSSLSSRAVVCNIWQWISNKHLIMVNKLSHLKGLFMAGCENFFRAHELLLVHKMT